MNDMKIGEAVLTIITTDSLNKCNIPTLEGLVARIEVEIVLLNSLNKTLYFTSTKKFDKALEKVELEIAERLLLEAE